MKTIILSSIIIYLISSCKPNASELKVKCNSLVNDSIFRLYNLDGYIEGHEIAIELCGDNVSLLQSEYENLLDAVAEAHIEHSIQKEIIKQQN